ncbi:MAG: hypothetical protein WD066_04010, partial [Planctomycetaceae bacterium]
PGFFETAEAAEVAERNRPTDSRFISAHPWNPWSKIRAERTEVDRLQCEVGRKPTRLVRVLSFFLRVFSFASSWLFSPWSSHCAFAPLRETFDFGRPCAANSGIAARSSLSEHRRGKRDPPGPKSTDSFLDSYVGRN